MKLYDKPYGIGTEPRQPEAQEPLATPIGLPIRQFTTGATRDTVTGKARYAAYIGWRALQRFGRYMMAHEVGPDGVLRAADNWKLGIPKSVYVDSLTRHVVDFNAAVEAGNESEAEELACAIWFNVQGWLQEHLK